MIAFLLVIIVALLLMLVCFKITEIVGKINNDNVIMPERKPQTPIIPPGAQGFRLLDGDDSPCPVYRPGSQGRPPRGGSNITYPKRRKK